MYVFAHYPSILLFYLRLIVTASASVNTVTYFEFVSHVLPIVYGQFRGSGAGAGTGDGPGAEVGAGAGDEVEMVDRAARATDDVMGDNGTASLSRTSTSPSVAATDVSLKTSRATTAIEAVAGAGAGAGTGRSADNGVRTEKQSEIMQVLEGDGDTAQGRGASKSTSMSMSAEGVTDTYSSYNKEKATVLHRRDSAFNIIPEYGIYDVTVEGDEEAADTYRNMLAVLPPPTV